MKTKEDLSENELSTAWAAVCGFLKQRGCLKEGDKAEVKEGFLKTWKGKEPSTDTSRVQITLLESGVTILAAKPVAYAGWTTVECIRGGQEAGKKTMKRIDTAIQLALGVIQKKTPKMIA